MVAIYTPAFDDAEPAGEGRELFHRAILPLRLELLRAALRMTSRREDAEDLLHDSLLKALGGIASLAEEENARAWMRAIMRNTYVSRVRLKSAALEQLVPGNELDDVSACIRRANADAERADVLAAIGKLDETHRAPVVLCDLEGHSYKEAADRIGCALGTLMSRLSRAREKLRRLLDS